MSTTEFRHPKKMPCPGCGEGLDCSTPIEGEGMPSPGDLTVCCYCASLLEYTEGLELRAFSQADYLKLDGKLRSYLEGVRMTVLTKRIGRDGPPPSDAYVRQVEKMSKNAAKWRAENPGREVLVQFNNPEKVFVSAAISEAIRTHLVSVNDAGLELIKAMWPWDDEKEPTIFMVRLALEHQTRSGLKGGK